MKTIVLLILMFIFACGFSQPEVPEQWARLGIPARGLVKVYDDTNKDGFYADYKTYSNDELVEMVRQGFLNSGFEETCNEFQGRVRGFKRGDLELVVKVDSLGDKQGLSVFNGNGNEKLIFGVCFHGYKLGEKENPVK